MNVARGLCGAFAATLLLLAPAQAQTTYPAKPVRMMVPFPPGGATDIIARMLTAKLQELWGQTVYIENRPGAATVVATEVVAKAPPDGYTLGFVITAHVVNPSLRDSLPYDTLRDLAAVSHVSNQHLVLAAHPGLEATSVAELIALAKKQPGKLAYGSPGSGTAMHLAMEMLKTVAGIDIVHVPYKGGGPAQQDAMAGRLPLVAEVHHAAQPNIRSGRLKALAMLSPERPSFAKDVPVVAETLPGVSAVSMVGIVAPGATPRELVRRIGADVARAVRSPDLAEKMQAQGLEPVGSTPEQFEAFLRTEIEKWAKVVKASGAKAD